MRPLRRGRRSQTNLNEIRVEVLEFKRRLEPDEFMEWLHSVESFSLVDQFASQES